MKTIMCVIGAVLIALVALALCGQQAASTVTPVLTRSGSNLRHGAYTHETVLKPSNISGLHKIYSIPIRNDARGIESQPLVMPGVKGSDGVTRDLIVLSSMANDVIAADLHTGKIIWQTNLGRPIKGTKQIDFWSINDNFGILSTGVIDPDTLTWYGVTWTSPDGTAAKGWHSLHAVDLRTGQETKKPLSMNPLTYNPGYGLEPAKFAGQMRKQRSALSLFTVQGRKVIAIPAGSVLETNGSASGWVAICDISVWRFTASWASTVRGFGGGIWMAGQGLTIDPATNDMFALTSNGSFDGTTDFSECFIRLRYVPPKDPYHELGKIDVVDWFSPYSDSSRIGKDPTASEPTGIATKTSGINEPSISGRLIEPVNEDSAHAHSHQIAPAAPASPNKNAAFADQDLGSGALAFIEQYGILGGAGKDGIWYSVNPKDMGKTMPEDFAHPRTNYAKLLSPPVWFTFAAFKHDAKGNVIGYEDTMPDDATKLNGFASYGGLTHHLHGSPIVANVAGIGTIVACWGENGNLREWKANPDGSLTFLGNGQEEASPKARRPPGGMTGGMLALSSNNTNDAIIWALTPDGDANREITTGKLYAYSAGNLAKYPDGSGWVQTLVSLPLASHPKFNTPIVTSGIVLAPTYSHTVEGYSVN